MSKYIDAEKLKAEIERKKAPFKKDIEDNVYPTYLCALMDFEDLIDSLQQEQPNVDLEKEIDNYLDTIQAWQIQEAPFTTMEKCARYFYELGVKARKEE